jgi:hypothetical protein
MMEAWITTKPWPLISWLAALAGVMCIVFIVACVPEKEAEPTYPIELVPPATADQGCSNVNVLPDGYRWDNSDVPPGAKNVQYLGKGWFAFELEVAEGRSQRFLLRNHGRHAVMSVIPGDK